MNLTHTSTKTVNTEQYDKMRTFVMIDSRVCLVNRPCKRPALNNKQWTLLYYQSDIVRSTQCHAAILQEHVSPKRQKFSTGGRLGKDATPRNFCPGLFSWLYYRTTSIMGSCNV